MFTKISKLYLTVIIVTLSFLLVSCAVVLSPLPVGIFSNAKFPLDYETGNNQNLEYQVLGTAYGTAKATSILGLFATGDASIATAYRNAINKYPEADCLTEISIDYQTESLLGIYASMMTIVKGKAIQFQKLSSGTTGQKDDRKVIVSEEKKDMAPEKLAQSVDELESWKKDILTYKDLQLKLKWKSFAKRNNIDASWEEWVQSLSSTDYEDYLQSNLTIRKWLGEKLEKNKEVEQVSQIKQASKKSENIKKWELILTKLPDGKLIGSESGLKGYLIFAEDKNLTLIFDQSGKKVEFEGKFYSDNSGSMTIEVEQVDAPQPRSKIYYKNVQLTDSLLILRSETGREYHFKK